MLSPDKMSPFEPLVAPTLYPHLSLLLAGSGLLFMALFFTMQVTTVRKAEDGLGLGLNVPRFLKEVAMAFVACLLLGFGLLFVCLNVGIYV
jgi:hypothetical protein